MPEIYYNFLAQPVIVMCHIIKITRFIFQKDNQINDFICTKFIKGSILSQKMISLYEPI